MILDKLKYGAINNKKIIFFLIGLAIISIISGSFFLTILSKSDQSLVKEYITNFMTSIDNNKIDYIKTLSNSLINNLGYIIIVWILGISIIGMPIVVFMFFSKIFVLGFSVSSFILTYKFKGLLFAFIYIFPQHIISLIIYTLITLYSIKVSNNLIYSIFKKKEINFKKILNRYILVFVICLGGILICSLYETFVIPFIFNKIQFLIK